MPIQEILEFTELEGTVRVSLEEARSALQSLMLLIHGIHRPGIADWVLETYQAMSRSERWTNEIVILGLHYAAMPSESWHSFPAYLDYLAAMEPAALRDKMFTAYESLACSVPRKKGRSASIRPPLYLRRSCTWVICASGLPKKMWMRKSNGRRMLWSSTRPKCKK